MPIGLIVMIAALVISYGEGEKKEFSLKGFVFMIVLGLVEMVAFAASGIYFAIGMPKTINSDATGAYTTLSRVNEGDASYSVAKDADGNIWLLQGEAKMPNLKSFAVNKKGEVVELK